MKKLASGAVTAAVASLLLGSAAGCGGSSSQTLSEGVYESEITSDYLMHEGLTADHAARDGGKHKLTLTNGSFTDAWESGNGEQTFCSGTYKDDGGTVTFTWISGCFGDWAANYEIDGDQVTWSDVKALPPNDSAAGQREAEIFNAVPWTRAGDPPSS